MDSRAPAAAEPSWRAETAGVWVATLDGRPVCIIQARWGKGFIATDRLGHATEVFPTLDAAREAANLLIERLEGS